MATVKAFYPEFVPNQVLTNTQLNQLREHLDLQDRIGRVRTVGTGKVCGLSWSVDAANHHLVVSEGYGITSEGYIVKLEQDTRFTHFRTYEDPDVDEASKPHYVPWRKTSDTGLQKVILELLDEETMSSDDAPGDAAALTAGTGTDRVLVLYLEKEPVSLRSCLVTDCDNKGLNVNLNLRVLLVLEDDLGVILGCEDPPPLARIPRLHTVQALDGVDIASKINDAYERIIDAELSVLGSKIGQLNSYAKLLNLDENLAASFALFQTRLTEADAGQYHYDALKDVASAYNEAVVAACELVTECCPDLDFPRHLMLGAIKKTTGGFCHEFRPAPVRNVFEGHLERVRQLFRRIGALCRDATFLPGDGVRITPSHTESEPLGKRAIPFYYEQDAEELWQPKLCCTTDRLWSYRKQQEGNDVDFDYGRCTFLRIEGHLGLDCEEAREQLVELSRARNLELDFLCTYLNRLPEADPELQFQALENSRETDLGKVKDLLAQLASGNAPRGIEASIQELAGLVSARNQRLVVARERWGTARAARKLHCDFSHLRAHYLALREQLLCTYHRLRGTLGKIALDLETTVGESLMGRDVRPLALGAKTMLADRIVASMTARTEKSARLGSSLAVFRREDASLFIVFTMVNALDSLRENLRSLVEEHLPKDVSRLHLRLFLEKQRDVVRDLHYWMLLRTAYELPLTGGAEDELLQKELEGALGSCHHRAVAALQLAYEGMRARDLSDFRNLATRFRGLEHLAGVEKGGTFVLVSADTGDGEEVVADFSLSHPIACCCEAIPEDLCLPPVAHLDYRIVTLSGENPVSLEIDVLGNDYDPNVLSQEEEEPLQISLKDEGTELGGGLNVTENRRILYEHESPPAGAVDRFRYDLTSANEDCPGSDTGEVLVLLLPEPPRTGAISGRVVIDDVGPAAGSTVRILETGQSTVADTKGRFEFLRIAAGQYTLVASGEGMTSVPVVAEVESGETVELEIFLVRRTGAIEGVVLSSPNKPAPGSFVALDLLDRTETNADGRFQFLDVSPGEHQLRASLAGFQSKAVPVTVAEGQTLSVQILLEAEVQTGAVLIAVRDATGALLPGVSVALVSRATGIRREAITNEKGEARFNGVPAGLYDATVALAGFGSVTEPNIEVRPGQTTIRQVILQQGPRFTINDDFVRLVATRTNLAPEEARARAEGLYGSRFELRLGAVRAPDLDPSVRNSISFARTEEFLVERLTRLEPDADLAGSFKEVSGTLSRAIASAGPANKNTYRDLLLHASLGFLDRITLTNQDSLSPAAQSGLEVVIEELEGAGVTRREIGKAWDGERLGSELGLGSAKAIMAALR